MTLKRILVTGAGGFIGYNLANELARTGFEIKGLDLHFPENGRQPRKAHFERVVGDFRDSKSLREAIVGADAIIHLASAHLDVGLPPREYWDINVRSIPALLEQARASGVQRFVHISSAGVYGRLAQCPADEETPCYPQSIYGRTKLEGERKALEFHRQSGFPVVVLRPAWVYGPGCPRTMKLFRALKNRRFVMIGSGRNLRHPVFIDDFITACTLALSSEDAVGEIIIIAGPDVLTTRELVGGFCSALDLAQPRARVPYVITRWLAVIAETAFGLVGKAPPISRRNLEFFDTDNAFDTRKAVRILGFKPVHNLQQGLASTRNWLEQRVPNEVELVSTGVF